MKVIKVYARMDSWPEGDFVDLFALTLSVGGHVEQDRGSCELMLINDRNTTRLMKSSFGRGAYAVIGIQAPSGDRLLFKGRLTNRPVSLAALWLTLNLETKWLPGWPILAPVMAAA